MPKEMSAGAVVFRRENEKIYYLLLHYKSSRAERKRGGHWDFAKGHIEINEREEDTVKREVKEETGIEDIIIIEGFKESIKYFFRQYKEKISEENKKRGRIPWVFKIAVFYLAESKTKEVKISPEHVGYEWLLYEDAMKKLTFKNARDILKKADDFLKKSGF